MVPERRFRCAFPSGTRCNESNYTIKSRGVRMSQDPPGYSADHFGKVIEQAKIERQ
jgi:hypothetical protein